MEKNDYKKIVASCFCSMMLVSSAWALESDLYAGGTGYARIGAPILN